MKNNENLVAVVCGMPFSGTTFLSRIISSHPSIDSGFECGMLFEESPKLFKNRKKFYSWMMSHERPYNWKLTEAQMEEICDTDDFYEAYARIIKHCHLYSEKVNLIVDKTPAYIYRLRSIMTKVSKTPVILVVKNPDFQYHSYKNRGRTIEEFKDLYEKQMSSINRVLNRPILKEKLLIINYFDLQNDLPQSIEKIFNHINKFHEVNFDKEKMLNDMLESINSDINSNQKKLRKRFDFKETLNSYKEDFTKEENEILDELSKDHFSIFE